MSQSGAKLKSKSESKILITQPSEFFAEAVGEAMKKKRLKTSQETEFYLVNLLKQFMSAEALYARDQNGNRTEMPLAFLVKEAMEAPDEESRKLCYRQLGDTALYMAGFFQPSLTRKIVDLEYYVGMGRTGYQNVATRVGSAQRTVFLELAKAFPDFVEVLAKVAEVNMGQTEAELVTLYDLWLRTGNTQAENKLKEAGILPKTKKSSS